MNAAATLADQVRRQWEDEARQWLLDNPVPMPVRAAAVAADGVLKDVHRLGVLRAVGPVYQFRHAAVHDYLAREQTSPP